MIDSGDLKGRALELGFDACGVCAAQPPGHFEAYRSWIDKGRHASMTYLADHLSLKADPTRLLDGAKSVVAVTLNYNQDPPAHVKIARYALGRDYHRVMRGKLRSLASWLDAAYPGGKHRACVDSAPIMERDFAQAAGLGWFGKNTMLIDSRRGSWFFIGLLLTTLEFRPDRTAVGGCGNCRACVDACPTGAIIQDQGRWQVDARNCISYLTIEHRGQIQEGLDTAGWLFGCDVCQEVCPFNEPRESQPMRGRQTQEPAFGDGRTWPTAEEIVAMEQPEWDELTRGSAIRRAGWEGLQRNASLAIRSQKR